MITVSQTEMRSRLHHLDTLRIFGIVAVFLFHCFRFFDAYGWHVKNPVTWAPGNRIIDASVLWLMPLFFFLSGVGSAFSMQRRGTGGYLGSRFRRIFIPLIFGVFVIVPPQVWLERLSDGGFNGSFWAFYPRYFDGWYGFGGNFGWIGLHLWYLFMLMLYTVLTLPLLPLLKRVSAFLEKRLSTGTAAVLCAVVLMIPVWILEITLDLGGFGRRDMGGWNAFSYPFIFMFGIIFGMNAKKMNACIVRAGIPVLITGLLIGGVKMALSIAAVEGLWEVECLARVIASWMIVLGLVGVAGRLVVAEPPFQRRLNEAVLPVYILHQTVILLVGYPMVRTGLSIPVKYAVILSVSAGLVFVLYRYLIMPWNPVRFLFGMGSKRRV